MILVRNKDVDLGQGWLEYGHTEAKTLLEIEMYKSRDRGWMVMCVYNVHGHAKVWTSQIMDRLTARRIAKKMKNQIRYDFVELVSVQ